MAEHSRSGVSHPAGIFPALLIISRINTEYHMVRLDQLPFRTPATVTSVHWAALTPGEARRLRNLGLDEGVRVEALHCGPFGKDPLAIKIGRMTVAIRRAHAETISVEAGQ
jgi:ferrous iron transport protein A